jgi:hypothetical protein
LQVSSACAVAEGAGALGAVVLVELVALELGEGADVL